MSLAPLIINLENNDKYKILLYIAFILLFSMLFNFLMDDLTDLYHNYNNVTAFVFRNIMKSTVNGVTMDCSTASN